MAEFNFKYGGENFILTNPQNTLVINSIGGEAKVTVEAREKMLVNAIRVEAYDKYGHLNGVADMPRDRFTIQIRYKNGSRYFFSEPVDINVFMGKNALDIMPTLIGEATQLEFIVKHEPIVTQGYQNNVDYTNCQFQVLLIGGKVV